MSIRFILVLLFPITYIQAVVDYNKAQNIRPKNSDWKGNFTAFLSDIRFEKWRVVCSLKKGTQVTLSILFSAQYTKPG